MMKEDVYVIVAVANKEVRHNENINEQLKAFPNIMRNPLGLSIYWGQTFDLDQSVDIEAALNEVENCFDETYSRELYRKLWDLRMQDKVIDYPNSVLEHDFRAPQYIVREIIDYERISSFVDCGAFTGDSLEDFIGLGTEADYYCFEMDHQIFAELKKNVDTKFARKKNRIHLYECGVSSHSETIHYTCDETGGSHADESGEETAGVVALDDMNFERKIDFIKMDIEGAEEEALRGARALICRDHPVLAISLYHNFSQFLNIPRMIKEIDPNYRIYLRHHKFTLDDTVCYAV